MKIGVLIGSCFLAASMTATAQTSGSCASLQSQYVKNADMSARWSALGIAMSGQASASLQNTVETKQSNALARVKIDIDLLKAAGCKIPPARMDPEKYEPEANACRLNLVMSQYGTTSVAGGTCTVTDWKGR